MQFKATFQKLILLLFFTSIVASCITVDKSVGDNYVPEDQLFDVKFADIELPISVNSMDSLQAFSTTYMTVGAMRTEEFGLYEVGSMANLAPLSYDTTAIRFGDDPQIKRIYLAAPISALSTFVDGQEAIPQDIYVYRTKKAIDSTLVYSSSFTQDFIEEEPLNATASTFFGIDTIKVYLNNEYGAELLSATDEELDSLDLFTQRFKGIYIKSSTPELVGGRINLASYASAYVHIDYSFQPDEAGAERKDTTISLHFGDYYCVNTSSYSTKDLETTVNSETLPVEGAAGVKPFISAKLLKSAIDNWALENNISDTDKIGIISATYHLPFDIPEDFNMETYPQYLFPTERIYSDTTGYRYYSLIVDQYSSGNNLGLQNRSLSEYYGDFSSYIQNLIIKDTETVSMEDDIWFVNLVASYDSYTGSTTTYLDTENYYMGKINGTAAEKKPYMRIIYTVID